MQIYRKLHKCDASTGFSFVDFADTRRGWFKFAEIRISKSEVGTILDLNASLEKPLIMQNIYTTAMYESLS
jgi:hypothetical protein